MKKNPKKKTFKKVAIDKSTLIDRIKNYKNVFNTKANLPPSEVKLFWDDYSTLYQVPKGKFKRVKIDKWLIATYQYTPKKRTPGSAPVIILHGYFDHSGNFNHLIDFLLKEGREVIAFDLPGHGFSSGPECDIQDFYDYYIVFKGIFQVLKLKPELTDVIAHSTGCVLPLYALLENFGPFNHLILGAPLVRIHRHSLATLAYKLLKKHVLHLRRKNQVTAQDQTYLNRVAQDPLQGKGITISWFQSYLDWVKKIDKYQPQKQEKVILIQGSMDKVLDWSANIRILRYLLPDLQIKLIPWAFHQIFNEKAEYRFQLWKHISSFLKG